MSFYDLEILEEYRQPNENSIIDLKFGTDDLTTIIINSCVFN